MGAVHEVLDDKTNTRRALKVMLPSLVESSDMRTRFAQEARVCGAIRSEHIVHVTDAGVDEQTGTPFLVMELLHGEELGGLLVRRGRLSRAEVVAYLFQAALALDKTHAAGVVHRDLKPENLFVATRDDGSPCVKILDFGIAKVIAQSSQPQTTKSVGTPLYMAPEQVQGSALIGPGADIYALGHIAYTLLVGEAYWSAEFKSEALLPFFSKLARGIEEPASRRAARREVFLSPAFDGWFLKATAVAPEDRFARATEAVSASPEAAWKPPAEVTALAPPASASASASGRAAPPAPPSPGAPPATAPAKPSRTAGAGCRRSVTNPSKIFLHALRDGERRST